MGFFSNLFQNVINFDVANEYSNLVSNSSNREAIKRWIYGYDFLGDCIPKEDKTVLDNHNHGRWERSKRFHQWFKFEEATYAEKEYIVQNKNDIFRLDAIFMKYYPALEELQNLRKKYQLGFDSISKKYANVIVVESKKQGADRFFEPNRRQQFEFTIKGVTIGNRNIYEVLSIAYMTLEERSVILAHKDEIAAEDKIQIEKKSVEDAKAQEKKDAEKIDKAKTIRSRYPNGYKYYVCGSLETTITMEYADKAIEKEELIMQKEREYTMNRNISKDDFSALKFGNISFKKWKKIAASDIRTYKVVSAKLPNRYNNHQEGEKRSFLNPDRFKAYKIGGVEQSELNLCKRTEEYDHEIKQYYQKSEIIGIPSYVEHQPCHYSQWYKVFSCECIIPQGAEYYEGYQDGKLVCYLSNKIEIKKILETRS